MGVMRCGGRLPCLPETRRGRAWKPAPTTSRLAAATSLSHYDIEKTAIKQPCCERRAVSCVDRGQEWRWANSNQGPFSVAGKCGRKPSAIQGKEPAGQSYEKYSLRRLNDTDNVSI